jgi:hypothetical protein
MQAMISVGWESLRLYNDTQHADLVVTFCTSGLDVLGSNLDHDPEVYRGILQLLQASGNVGQNMQYG